MGMYDSFVGVPVHCQKCRADMNTVGFQSNDLLRTMTTYRWGLPMKESKACIGTGMGIVGEFSIYAPCNKCDHWNEFVGSSEPHGIFAMVRFPKGKVIAQIPKEHLIEILRDELITLRKERETEHEKAQGAGMLLLYLGYQDALPCASFQQDDIRALIDLLGYHQADGLMSLCGALAPARMALTSYLDKMQEDALEKIEISTD